MLKKVIITIVISAVMVLFIAGATHFDFSHTTTDTMTTHKTEKKQETHKKTAKKEETKQKKNHQYKKASLQSTVKKKNHKYVVTNPASVLVCINKKRNLPAGYTPENLVIPDVFFPGGKKKNIDKTHMRKTAAKHLEHLFRAAKNDDIRLTAISGYRSYDYQVAVFSRNIDQYGSKKKANQISAHPGQSEHQTGLVMDVSTPAVGNQLTQEFGDTKAGEWVKRHAADYGFIVRYLKGEEDVTGYEYEPWHLRYVGKKAAKQITNKNITLEEFLEYNK